MIVISYIDQVFIKSMYGQLFRIEKSSGIGPGTSGFKAMKFIARRRGKCIRRDLIKSLIALGIKLITDDDEVTQHPLQQSP